MSGREARVERLIREARSGSTEALEHLLSECRNYLLTIANRALSDSIRKKIGASDLVQDTMVEAIRGFGEFRGDSLGALLAWLRKVLLHNVANASRTFEQTEKRDLSREVSLDKCERDNLQLVDPASSPGSTLANRELDQQVASALNQLPVEMRLAVELRNRDHLSFCEIGAQMERSPEAARKLWARAIEKLREKLAEIGGLDR